MNGSEDRRRSSRVELMGQLQGELVSMDLPIVVREISLGGMSLETPVAFEVGTQAQFMLTLGDGAGVLVAGRVVHCTAVEGATPPAFVSGVQFLDEGDFEDGPPNVGDLIHKIK